MLATTVLALSGSRTVQAGTCVPRVELTGDASVAAPIADRLHALGDPTERDPAAGAPCKDVRVDVAATTDGAIAVTLHDASNRVESRVVSNAMIASAWIDSWARDELLAPPSQAADLDLPAVTARAPAPTAHGPWLLDRAIWTAAYEHTWSGNGASWDGGSIAACVRFGGACVGGRVRAAFEPNLAAGESAAARDDLSALAIARWNTHVGQLAIAPELGIGVGRFATSRVEACGPPPPQGGPPACDAMHVFVGDQLSASTLTPRFEAGVGISIPLVSAVWLDGSASVTAAPGAHTGAYNTMMPPMGTPPDQVALPGEPSAAFQVAIGLRVGANP